MATGQSLIDRACRLLGVISSGESASTEESADGLIAMNAMIDSWRNDRLMAFSLSETSKAMVVGDSSYTIGSGGDFNTTRPTEIKHAYMIIGTTEYPVQICTDSEWYAIEDRTSTSDLVEKIWYNPTMSTGTVNVWPVPNATNTLYLVVKTPVADLTLVGTVALPPGWEKAIAYNLAIELAPEFTVQVPPAVMKGATESLAAIKRTNSVVIKMDPGLPRKSHSSILTG